jgi:hypothetical protein
MIVNGEEVRILEGGGHNLSKVNYENPQKEKPVNRFRFEPGIYGTQVAIIAALPL